MWQKIKDWYWSIFFSDKQQECDLPIYGGGGGHSDAIQSSLTSGATPSTGCNIIHYYVYQFSKKKVCTYY